MRVLALVHAYIPVQNAGAEVMLHELLTELVRRGHYVDVIVSRQPGQAYALDGIHVWPEGGDVNALRALCNADVVITHLENTPRAAMLGRLNGVPVVEILHNTMPVTKHWLTREPPALAVANSLWMQREVVDHLNATVGLHRRPRVPVVRPPVRVADYATTPGDRVTLINLRKMEPSQGSVMGKGAELFWALAQRMPDVGFLGVEGGYGSQLIRSLPNVEVLPHLPADQMRDRVYARTRVLLMPSSYESWGRTGVEAMCSGIPVIAHPTPGLLESLGSAGHFVDRSDVDGWVGTLRALGNAGTYRIASQHALDRAAELDPAEDLDRWCDAVEDVASRRLVRT